MPVGSIVAANALLNATIGDLRAAGIQALFYMTFFNGDPSTTGVELTAAGGFQRTAVAWTDSVWAAPAGGFKPNGVVIESIVSSGAWSANADHVGFMDAATLGTGNLWDYGPLDSLVVVNAANMLVRFDIGDLKIGVA